MSSSIVPVPIESDDDRWISIVRYFFPLFSKTDNRITENFAKMKKFIWKFLA